MVDDGSVDESAEILRELADQRGDRDRLLKADHIGPYPARNLALAHATGQFVAFLDSDDWWLPETLTKLRAPLVEHQADIAYCGWRNVGHYSVVGEGHRRGELEALAEKLGLRDSVHFMGRVHQRTLVAIYGRADLFILTSSITPHCHEGFGIVYLEAAASGVPSLAARLAGAVEAVDEGVSGLFVEEPTVVSIASALEGFLKGTVKFDRQACREFAQGFSWSKVVDHAMSYYLEVTSR